VSLWTLKKHEKKKEIRTDIARKIKDEQKTKMFIYLILFNQMKLMFVHLIALMDELNMLVEFEIIVLVVELIEVKHLTFLYIYIYIYYLELFKTTILVIYTHVPSRMNVMLIEKDELDVDNNRQLMVVEHMESYE